MSDEPMMSVAEFVALVGVYLGDELDAYEHRMAAYYRENRIPAFTCAANIADHRKVKAQQP